MEEIGRVTQQNAASAEQSSTAAEELSTQAHELAAAIGAFRLEGARIGPEATPASEARRARA
ncbi:MAG TPA: hypothetical protein VFP65_10475 [Anaeromyxobacteraceae bacterium]|nr:hypothetical protein [Anaeromyxobacteraceae bacterium]